jgi:hypothetical protein
MPDLLRKSFYRLSRQRQTLNQKVRKWAEFFGGGEIIRLKSMSFSLMFLHPNILVGL